MASRLRQLARIRALRSLVRNLHEIRIDRAQRYVRWAITSMWIIASCIFFVVTAILLRVLEIPLHSIISTLPAILAGLFGLAITMPLLIASLSDYSMYIPLFGTFPVKAYVASTGLLTMFSLITQGLFETGEQGATLAIIIVSASCTSILLLVPFTDQVRSATDPWFIVDDFDESWGKVITMHDETSKDYEKKEDMANRVLDHFEKFLFRTIDLKDYELFGGAYDEFWTMFGRAHNFQLDFDPSYGPGKGWTETLRRAAARIGEDPVLLSTFGDESFAGISSWIHAKDRMKSRANKDWIETFELLFLDISKRSDPKTAQYVFRPLVPWAILAVTKDDHHFLSFAATILSSLQVDTLNAVLPRKPSAFELKQLNQSYPDEEPRELLMRLRRQIELRVKDHPQK